MIDILKKKTKC